MPKKDVQYYAVVKIKPESRLPILEEHVGPGQAGGLPGEEHADDGMGARIERRRDERAGPLQQHDHGDQSLGDDLKTCIGHDMGL